MITLKELETLCCIAEVGSFERAAARLHTTQSAVSKRVRQLRATLGVELFERSGRRARLNAKGEEIRALGAELLALRDRLVERAGQREVVPSRLRLGVTELTAMTWLPALVRELRTTYPGLVIEPEVAPSAALVASVLGDAYDLIITPHVKSVGALTTVPLAEVENVWACSPSIAPARRSLPLTDIRHFTVLTQGGRSTVGVAMDRWLRANGVRVSKTVSTNNLVALVGLTVAGLGVSYVPRACFSDIVESGMLTVLHTTPTPPRFPYVLAYRKDRANPFHEAVAQICQRVCDFTKRYETLPLAPGSAKTGSSPRRRASPPRHRVS